MRIYDFTEGAFATFIPEGLGEMIHKRIANKMREWHYPLRNFMFKRFGNENWGEQMEKLLNDVPVFLVCTGQTGQKFKTHFFWKRITIPEDRYKADERSEDEINDEIREWFERIKAGVFERTSGRELIYDRFGVYDGRVFVWVDKIAECVKGDVDEGYALLQYAILYEYAHALMDVRLYGVEPYCGFSYSDTLYRCIEEILATAFAQLTGVSGLNESQEKLVRGVVGRVSMMSDEGMSMASEFDCYTMVVMRHWMQQKVMFDDVTIGTLEEYWKFQNFDIFPYSPMVKRRAVSLYYPIKDDMESGLAEYSDWMRGVSDGYYESIGSVTGGKRYSQYYCFGSVTCATNQFTSRRAERKWDIYVSGVKRGVVNGDILFVRAQGDGLFAVCMRNGKWGLLGRDGKWITEAKYDFIWKFGENGLCKVDVGRKSGMVNRNGEEVIPPVYYSILDFENGVTFAKLGKMYGVIDEHNNTVHSFDLKYREIRGLQNGYATMQDVETRRWGAIDAKGNVVVPCKYDSFVEFNEKGMADVMIDGEWHLINTNGEMV